MKRRRFIGGLVAGGSVVLAGCLGGEDGDGYRFDAEPASVPSESLSSAGYEDAEPESFSLDEAFDVPGVGGRVSVTTWIVDYENASRGSALFVASTPNATIAGQSVNPLARAEPVELLRRLVDAGDGGPGGGDVDDLEERGSATREVLGRETEVARFEAHADVDAEEVPVDSDEEVPVSIHVATVEHRDDVIALVGVHPQAVDETETLLSLMTAVEH